MFPDALRDSYQKTLDEIRDAGLWKPERVLVTPQDAEIQVAGGAPVLNFCANNYLGLGDRRELLDAAKEALDQRGYGLSSVRFICGTQDRHRELEARLSNFLGTDDTILYSSCFDANGGLFETLLSERDAIVSDELNHASIIDGIRLCKAMRYRYKNCDVADMRAKLQEAKDAGAERILVATDGVFSMDGFIAPLGAICDAAERFSAMVMVDDSHAVGFMGRTGRGTHEHNDVMGRVDVITGTLGKALGGASGGYTSGRAPLVQLLRQRSRPYLFSNTLMPAIVGASIAVLDLLEKTTELRDRLETNTRRFRDGMKAAGFAIPDGIHPIAPVMLGDARLANDMAARLLQEGIYVIGFSYPVVPKGKARIRVQLSAAHTEAHVDRAIAAFTKVGRELGVIA